VTVGLARWAVAALAIAAASPARAEPDAGYARMRVVTPPRGLHVGAALVGTAIVDQSGGPDLLASGTGLRLLGGWRLSHRLALEVGWATTFHEAEADFGPDADTLVLSGFTGDAKIYLGGGGERVDPFVQGGVGFYLLGGSHLDAQSIGSGFQVGPGIDLHVTGDVDITLRALYRGVAMGPPDQRDDDTFLSALGAEVGVSLLF
jgi:hypothetical protein